MKRPSAPESYGEGRRHDRDLAAVTKPLDWARATGSVEPVLQAIERHARARRRRRRRISGAMAAAAIVALAGMRWRPLPRENVALPPSASAVVSLPARQVLPDGSVVELKEGAAIAVDFRADVRRVTLERGEAHFQVTKNAARPFVVETGTVAVRAVGTAFSVQRGANTIEVLVTEGRIAVAESATPPIALVDAGYCIVVDTTATTPTARAPEAIAPEAMQAKLAWRVARLEFNGTPLAEVVGLFNRHASGVHPVRLALADPAIGKLPLSGVLRADNISVLLTIVETAYGLQAKRGSDGELVLYRDE